LPTPVDARAAVGGPDYRPRVRAELQFRSRCADASRAAWFEEMTRGVHAGLALVADQWGTPPAQLTVVLADDFPAAVDEVLVEAAAGRGVAHQPFTPERLSGVVVAKHVSLTADESRAAVVFNAALHSSVDPRSRRSPPSCSRTS